VPLTPENATGNGVPSTEDLITVQGVFLREMGSLRSEIIERIDGVCDRLTDIETARKVEAAVVLERQEVARKAEADHAAQAAEERRAAAELAATVLKKTETNILTRHWRVSLAVAAFFSAGSLALGVLNFVTSR
jgi:predicted transcriptional regulator